MLVANGVSLGLGIVGIVCACMNTEAWIVLSIVSSVFLIGAAAQHIKEIFADKNFSPGNTFVLICDIGLPISLRVLLFAMGAV